jgi:hypothetical protein
MQTKSRTARSVPLGRRAARECHMYILSVHTIILYLFSCCIVLNVIRLSESAYMFSSTVRVSRQAAYLLAARKAHTSP